MYLIFCLLHSSLLASPALTLSAVLSSSFSFQVPENRIVCHMLSVQQSKESSKFPQSLYPARNQHLTLGRVQEGHRLGTWLLNQEIARRALLLHGAESFYLHCCCAQKGCILQSAAHG